MTLLDYPYKILYSILSSGAVYQQLHDILHQSNMDLLPAKSPAPSDDGVCHMTQPHVMGAIGLSLT